MKFYLHRGDNYFDWYFCRVGPPYQVGFLRYCWARLNGYHTTVAPNDDDLCAVHVRAQIAAGSHPSSHSSEAVRSLYKPNNSITGG